MVKTAILLIRAYRFALSPLLPPTCRFYPSCSQYALLVLQSRSMWKAGALIVIRLFKCHPFHPGGYDPPPAGPSPSPHNR